MIDTNSTEEEVTTINNQSPQQVIKKTVRQVQPEAKGEAPQKVYETKKTIFRSSQIIWYILGFVEVLLIFRVVLKALGANQSSGFTNLVYSITDLMVSPFRGILPVSMTGGSVIEWSTLIAAIVYLCIAWGLIYLLDIIYPITPKDVETQ